MPLAVVIVTYHSAGIIADCLNSLRDLPGARVIVVDNASTDDTLDVVRKTTPDAEIVARRTNDGFAAGVNAGFAAAGNADVLVLNPDVRLEPGAVKALRAALEVPGTGIAVPLILGPDGERHPSLRRRPTPLRALGEAVLGGTRAGRVPALGELVVGRRAYSRPSIVDWATGACWLISDDCRKAVGPMEERYFLYSEETEYHLRAGDSGYAVRFEPAAVAIHLGGEQSTSAELWALSATNRVRLRRERDGRAAALGMRLAVLANELPRALLRGGRHWRAVRDLLWLRRWPVDQPGYICFSAQDWWYHNQAHSDFQLMRSVAGQRRVLVVNSIGMRMPTPGRSTQVVRRILRKLRSVAKFVRRPEPGFYVMSPLPLPFYGSPLLRRINATLVRAQVRVVAAALRMREPVIMATIPTAWDVVAPMRRRSLVFNRSDRHSDFPEADRGTIEQLEGALLDHADHVLYVSHALLDEEHARTGERAYFLDHGVDVEHFRPRAELPADLAAIPGPRLGFFGALDDFLVDFDLLEHVAEELPDCSLVLVGGATHDMTRFERYPNVHWLGFRPYATIPSYGSGFDVALMPWLDNEWIRHSNPIKLKEYLALGLPVVSTDFDELAAYRDRVRVAHDPAAFVAAIRESLAHGAPVASQRLRESVLGYSWRSRAAELVRLAESG